MSILQGYSLLLVMSIVVVVTEAIFYTNSKENDYPRLGRRKRPTDEVHWQNEKDIYAVIKSRELTNTESLEPLRYLALFYTLDRNSDGLLSKNEFLSLSTKDFKQITDTDVGNESR